MSTPQDLALRDAVRGIDLFKKVNVPILGMVQNMSTFVCTNCGHEHDVFGLDGMLPREQSSPYLDAARARCADRYSTGARRKCEELKITLLGDIPLHSQICADADAGRPTVVSHPDGVQAEAFRRIAGQLLTLLDLPPR